MYDIIEYKSASVNNIRYYIATIKRETISLPCYLLGKAYPETYCIKFPQLLQDIQKEYMLCPFFLYHPVEY
jgi:hypothetical protein